VGLSLVARVTRAQTTEPIELDWPAHEGCPSREKVLAEAYRLLGGKPQTSARRVRAEATVTPSAGAWRLEMQTESDGSRGKRSLSAESCSALGEAAALILVLAYDPEAVARHGGSVDPAPQPQPQPAQSVPNAELLPPPPPKAPLPAPRAVTPPAPARPPRSRPQQGAGTGRSWNLVAGGHIASDLGSLPAAAFGLGGSLALVVRRVRIDLEALSGEAAAELLGIGLPAMKSRLHRARLRLVAAFRASEGGVVENEREVGGLSCRAVLERLGDYVDGDLAPAETARVDGHLRGCSVCERFGGRYASVVNAARGRLGAPPALDRAELERIRAILR
jgi:hypothetical protein